mmetsp:Transcript_24678/g.29892  ORF Transcript_24678/g.29892 Transcript_24678/m.29892 type:complete len:126 (-) Transcript_24678:863-1240(-)|eukprot:CAMPEP_0197861092 /NCGR_PEP_ID=MMETSP1438-20131217/36927_1 /TAXON_ID=1461541 /ORGANISM="Pterosperma sp., Strain CCMP1384" /LENGTH=125 /DNA_ID=CAMNT_0043478165 /DNA_START=78 /DNA_END=455 /DNA_ORIENTATION=+
MGEDLVKVESLRPGTSGHNLVVKVVNSKLVVNRSRPDGSGARIAECTVGDETGIITLTARNAQVDVAQPGKVVTLKNAKIDMFKGSMRLSADKGGAIEASDATVKANESYDLSALEYEMVHVYDD